MPRPVFAFTDFGAAGPYLSQMTIAVQRTAPGAVVLPLQSDAPVADPLRAGYLLAALTPRLPADAVVIAVVDPGVGGPRRPLVAEAGGRVFVGPDNGLLVPVLRAEAAVDIGIIDWRPETLSASFHGRDLFAPVAGMVSLGRAVAHHSVAFDELVGIDQPLVLPEVIYIDHFGNAFTGIPASGVPAETELEVAGNRLRHAETFSAVAAGEAFWYGNSCGLVEIAANGVSAADRLGLRIGTEVSP